MNEPKLVFWTWALVNMAAALGCAGLGIQAARQHRVQRHKRLMASAAALVVLFLVAFVAKSSILGREALESWTEGALLTLRIHETFVAVMLLAGGYAGWLAWRMPPPRRSFPNPAARRRHGRAGWIALSSGFAGLVLAAMLLAQM